MKIKDLVTFEVKGKKCIALVRKLTEREAFRLMGVDEAHIDTTTKRGGETFSARGRARCWQRPSS